MDIPNHNVGYVMLSLLFAGIAIQPKKTHAPVGLLPRIAARLAGVAILASSVGWAALVMNRPILPGDSMLLRSSGNRLRLWQTAPATKRHWPPSMRPSSRQPMNGMSYFLLRRKSSSGWGRPSNAALADFARARALYPRYVPICMDEAQIWLKFDPPRAIIPWREALRRNPNGASRTYGLYAQMLELGCSPLPRTFKITYGIWPRRHP